MGVENAPDLTFRQIHVLALTARGFSRNEIGLELCISPRTVKEDVDTLRAEIGARNVAHAVYLCMACGLLSLEDPLLPPADTRERLVLAPAAIKQLEEAYDHQPGRLLAAYNGC